MAKRSIAPQRGFFPQPSYLIGTYKDDGKPNFSLVTLVTFCSVEPPMLMFASRGKKATRQQVKKNGMFTVNLVTSGMMDIADYFGIRSGFSMDKCEAAKVNTVRSEVVNAPVLEISPWVYECILVATAQTGDGTIYIGEIKNILADEKIPDTSYGKIDMMDMDPMIYAPGGYYSLGKRIGNVGESKNKF